MIHLSFCLRGMSVPSWSYVWTVLEVPWRCPMDSAVGTKEAVLLGKWAGTSGAWRASWVWQSFKFADSVSSFLFCGICLFYLVAAMVGKTTESPICSSSVGGGSVCFSTCDRPLVRSCVRTGRESRFLRPGLVSFSVSVLTFDLWLES